MSRIFPFLAAIGAGGSLYAAFPPVGFWAFALLGIALFVSALDGRSLWGSFGLGLLTGATFFIPLFDWAATASGVLIAQIALGITEALFIAVLAVLWHELMRVSAIKANVYLKALSFGVTWAAIEQLRSAIPFGGMPWGILGFSQVGGPLVRLAPWGSTALVGAVVVVIGVLVEYAIRKSLTGHLIHASIAGGSAIALGVMTAFLPLPTQADSYITVGFAQGIVPRQGELPAGVSQALTVTQNLADATSPIASGQVDLMVWPESASDRDPRTDPEAAAIVGEVAGRLGVPLVLGTQEFYDDYRYNNVLVWQPDGSITGMYAKQHPVPFGEYMPMREFFRMFTTAVDQVVVDMRAGSEPAVLRVETPQGSVILATPICFEVAVTAVVAEAVNGGAQLIVVPTNNSSFGDTAESRQQFDMTRFRAVETGRTAIQVSTVGVSGIVEPNGVVRMHTDPWVEAYGVARVGLRSDLTFATRFSGAIEIAVYAAGGILTALALAQRLKKGRR